MPYKIDKNNPKQVDVKKNGKWVKKGVSARPEAYLKALYAHMPKSEKK